VGSRGKYRIHQLKQRSKTGGRWRRNSKLVSICGVGRKAENERIENGKKPLKIPREGGRGTLGTTGLVTLLKGGGSIAAD